MAKFKRKDKSDRGPAKPARRQAPIRADAETWIYGLHAADAALRNPRRCCHRMLITETALTNLDPRQICADLGVEPEIVARETVDDVLPPGAVHQGIAVLAGPLPRVDLADVLRAESDPGECDPIVVLDQVTDPQNVGAVVRAAAAFGARAVLLPSRHAPQVTGALAKAASGALEAVPLVHVTNLARAIDDMKTAGFWCYGLDAAAGGDLSEIEAGGRLALILGAEGAGLRRLTREKCDALVRIPTRETRSLNVSTASAIALYEVTRNRP